MNRISTQSFALAVVTSLIGLGCGSNKDPAPQVTGVASSASSATTVSLKDSSSPAILRTASPDGSGRFTFDATGLSPPFFLKATTPTGNEYSVASAVGKTDVNTVTSAACAGSSSNEDSRDCEEGWSGRDRGPHDNYDSVLRSLRTVLKPLFDLYGIRRIGGDDDDHDGGNLRKLLHDVSFVVDKGIVTVTNRATGGVIFVGQLRHLSDGTYYPQNLPGSPGGATTCTSFTYSAYGDCQPNNTQARTVQTSSPSACTGGTPSLTQACNYVPPPNTCTSFTYSAYGDCQPGNIQARTVQTSSPSGCTGGSPALTQACNYVPPVTTCTSFTYSAFAACQPNNTQVRTVLTSSPAGCTGGTPAALTQACTYVPPVNTCTSFTYSAFAACLPNNTQVRTVLTSSPAGCTGGTPAALTQACTYVPPVTTCTSFTYSAFAACQPDNTQVRTVLTSSPSGCTGGTPSLTQACTYAAPCTLAVAVPSCSTCHGAIGSGTHASRPQTCATCHGPVNNGTGTPSVGMSAALSGTTCRLSYPAGSGTHDNGTVNFGAAQ
jgi:hypothetical protein